MQISVLEAKIHLAKLIRLLEAQREERIIITRAGKPIAQITLYSKRTNVKRLGVTKN